MRFILVAFVSSFLALIVLNYVAPTSGPIDLLIKIQSHNSKELILGLQKITNLISLISIGIPVLILLISEIKKDKSKRKKILIVLICLAFSGIVSSSVKNIVQKPRPFETDNRIEKLSGGGSYSFPSGHTTEAVCAATIMIFTFRYWYVWIFYISWALVIMYSRMALGVHDIFDLLGGLVIGFGSTYLVLFVASKLSHKKIS